MPESKASNSCPNRNHDMCTTPFEAPFMLAADLVPWKTKMRVFGKLPASTKVRAIGEICHLRNPEKLIAGAVVDPSVMGPKILYKLLLDHVGPVFLTDILTATLPLIIHFLNTASPCPGSHQALREAIQPQAFSMTW